MRLLVTGGTGVLGRGLSPLATAAGHQVTTPTRHELDLFDPVAVADATRDIDAELHLATRIRSLEHLSNADAGGRGVVLRFGLLDGPGTGNDEPIRDFGATLHVHDAARALLSALSLPSGTYNVCRDGERVSNDRFTQAAGWLPTR
jgi:nucleoside-diphosphate-sugar epimerase